MNESEMEMERKEKKAVIINQTHYMAPSENIKLNKSFTSITGQKIRKKVFK
jgi:hypothetical protein